MLTCLAAALLLAAAPDSPLPLPDNFNPETHLLAKTTETGTYHESRAGASLARRLVADGRPEALALAEQVIDATLACQMLDAESPRYGNFVWMREDDEVRDPNAAAFVLGSLIPMMLEHADRLPPDTQDAVRRSIRLALGDIARIDVALSYTNIAAKDITNTHLGGELLGDAQLIARAQEKLRAWEAYTLANGTAFEFNSPTYLRVTLGTLGRLIRHTQHEATRARARAMATRLGLSAALRIHPATGRLAGPHSRAYQPSIVAAGSGEAQYLRSFIDEGVLPEWLGVLIDRAPLPRTVIETASTRREISLTTHVTRAFALGTGTRGYAFYGQQSNLWMLHYARPDAPRPGVVYARYLFNDRWLGDFYHATDRSTSRNLLDEGFFYGVQDGARSIGVYTSGNASACTSAKAVLIWTDRAHLDAIWIDRARVSDLPAEVPDGAVLVVAAGEAYLGVRPFAPTDLGGARVRLVEQGEDLVLEMVNYRGSARDLRMSRDDRPHAGYYAEAAARDAFADGAAFAQTISEGTFSVGPAQENPRHTAYAYARDGQALGLEIDRGRWTLERRWTHAGDLGWPALESPLATQAAGGTVALNGAVVQAGAGPVWLYAAPADGLFVAGYHGPAAPVTLTLPDGTTHETAALASGTVVYQAGAFRVEGVEAAR